VDQHGQNSLIDRLRLEPWQGIVAAVEGSPGGLTLRNAWHYDDPIGAPVIQVAASAWERLSDLNANRAPLQVACGAARIETTAANVVARVQGRERSLPPFAVLTPRSGWWNCAGERGGGLAIWLELARCFAKEPLRRDVVFLATTGHELGFLGIQRFLERDPDLAADARLWIHLGANIGAANSPSVVRSAEADLLDVVEEIAEETFHGAARPELHCMPQPAGGEGLIVARAGGRYISLVGKGFALFHSTEDRWPLGSDAEAIALNARMTLELCRRLDAGA
jgi:hypothetical protein